MRDELLLYYERELAHLRRSATLFAEKYPKVASRLVLEPDKCEDPHVERLLEAFAFLTARVHLKIDDEFPEITESLLQIVYPHYTRPIPSMSIAEFQIDPVKSKLTTGFRVERGSLLDSRRVGGIPCRFRTCYDLVLWPLTVAAAQFAAPELLSPPIRAADSVAAARIDLQCGADVIFPALDLDSLQFFLTGDSPVVYKLYELLFSRLTRVIVRDPTPGSRVPPVTLGPECVEPAGFGEDEIMMPHDRRSFFGYHALMEYFAFPEKFLFFRIKGLREAWAAGFKGRAEIVLLFSRFEGEGRDVLERGVSASTFRLGCSPVVNLFPHAAEPILLTQRKFEYPVVPDVRRPLAMEVFSVDEVWLLNMHTSESREVMPFYCLRHTAEAGARAFWNIVRRPSTRANDNGTDLAISLVDLSLRPAEPDADTLHVRTTCTNRDLPARLPFGNEAGDFDLENNGPIERIVALTKPTQPQRPALGKSMQWRLISHLSLNYLSLVGEGRNALQEILSLYNFSNSLFTQKMIEGISAVSSRPHFARVLTDQGIAFSRGTRVELELDELGFVGGGVFLFASVLEHFLAHYVSINSFSQLVARTQQRKEVMRAWPPRTGRKILM